MIRWSGNKTRSGSVSLIGEGGLFDGTLRATSDLRIEGEFHGALHSSGDVVVGEKGCIRATELHAHNVVVAGQLEGCVQADGFVRITATGRLTGSVKACSLIIEQGAVFQGRSEMTEAKKDAIPDPVMI